MQRKALGEGGSEREELKRQMDRRLEWTETDRQKTETERKEIKALEREEKIKMKGKMECDVDSRG